MAAESTSNPHRDSAAAPPPDAASPSPFHAGERALQARAGVREQLERAGRRVLRDFMPDQHRDFFAQLPMLLAGSVDAQRRPWASILVGHPGFVRSPDARTLRVAALPGYGDPLAANLVPGRALGLLGIELETRRRNRMNGTVSAVDAKGFTVAVGQSFGNCPKYIQARRARFVADPAAVAAPRPVELLGPLLAEGARRLIAGADTFFIATAALAAPHGDATEGVDVSHRGGPPGFVRVEEASGASLLTIPDFAGNLYFNTLGNVALNPRAGLLFVDFASGGVLSLTGAAELVWDDRAAVAPATGRLLRFRPTAGLWIANAVPLRWSAPEPAPQFAAMR